MKMTPKERLTTAVANLTAAALATNEARLTYRADWIKEQGAEILRVCDELGMYLSGRRDDETN